MSSVAASRATARRGVGNNRGEALFAVCQIIAAGAGVTGDDQVPFNPAMALKRSTKVGENVSRMNPVPRAVILDLDDTLCDYSAARELRLRVAFSRALERLDSPSAIDLDRLIKESIQVQPHGTDHFADLLAPYGVNNNAVSDAAEWFRQNRFYGLKLFPESISVLRALRRVVSLEGAYDVRRVGIVTNGPTDVQRAKLNYLGLSAFADFIVISEEFGVAKPHPEIFQEALRLANVEPGDAVVVGDSPEFDMVGAQGVGIRSVWLNRRGQTWPGAYEKPTAEIRSLTELSLLLGDDTV